MTLQKIDGVDLTTHNTIQATITSLANLTTAAALVTVSALDS